MLRQLLAGSLCFVAAAAGLHLALAKDAPEQPRQQQDKQPRKAVAARPQALQSWIDAHVRPGAPARLDASAGPIAVTGPVTVPAGARLTIAADLAGQAKAQLILAGDAELTFDGGKVTNVPLVLQRGQITIRGLRYSGRAGVAAINIGAPGPFKDLLIEDVVITDANYGILRQGLDSTMIGGTIRQAHFARLHGDAIEWNVVPHDRGLVIDGVTIDGIDDPNGKPNWGIGVGVAGARYDPDWAADQTATDFVIRNVQGRGLRQLIHVEAAKGFRVENIVATDISPRYSAKSGMHSAAFACYGCRDFTVSNFRADSGGMKLFAGWKRGVYINPSRDFTLSDVHLAKGGIGAEFGGVGSYGVLERVTLDAGSIDISGALQRLDMTDVRVTSARRDKEPLIERPFWLRGALAGFTPPSRGGKRQRVTLERGSQ